MSAIILPFRRPQAATLSIHRAERAEGAAWAARLAGQWGGSWRVETHLGEDGEAWLGLVTPSSHGRKEEELALSWLICRTPEGISLTRMPSGRVEGVFHTVARALGHVEQSETTPRRISYGRG